MTRWLILLAVVVCFLILISDKVSSTETNEQPPEDQPLCLQDRRDGRYYARGYPKDGGVVCVFIYDDLCPYNEYLPADDIACKKPQPPKVKSVNKKVIQYGGK